MFPKTLVEDPAGKEGWPEGAAEPRMLDGDVHFVSKQHLTFNLVPVLPVHLYTPLATATDTGLDLSGTMM